MKLSGVHIAADVTRALEEMYGAPGVAEGLAGEVGVSHVVAVWRPAGGKGEQTVLRIGAQTPRSELDFFALNVARARAEAILTTGKILREEAELRHSLQGPGAVPLALAAWRRDRIGLADPPWVVILTSGRGLDPGHPAFGAPVRPVIFTNEEGARRVRSLALPGTVEVVSDPGASPRRAIDWLRREKNARRISIEAGPSVARTLYEPPIAVREILLSAYLEEQLPDAVRGEPFVEASRLAADFELRASARNRQESGHWQFERWCRRAS